MTRLTRGHPIGLGLFWERVYHILHVYIIQALVEGGTRSKKQWEGVISTNQVVNLDTKSFIALLQLHLSSRLLFLMPSIITVLYYPKLDP